MIFGWFLSSGFRDKLASLGLLGEMSRHDLAQERITGVAGEA